MHWYIVSHYPTFKCNTVVSMHIALRIDSELSAMRSRSIEIILDKLPRHKIGRAEINGGFLCGEICPKLLWPAPSANPPR